MGFEELSIQNDSQPSRSAFPLLQWPNGLGSCRNSVCHMLQAAESGNVEDFGRLYLAEPGRLGVRDSRGRAAAHQAAARNKLNILQFIAAHGGGMTYYKRNV